MGGMVFLLKYFYVKKVWELNFLIKYVMFDFEDMDGVICCI